MLLAKKYKQCTQGKPGNRVLAMVTDLETKHGSDVEMCFFNAGMCYFNALP